MNYPQSIAAIAAVLTFGACATTEGTKPHDMSKAQHEAAASREDANAKEHGGQYAPNATATVEQCSRGGCWTSKVNPTEQHKRDAQERKRLAQEHRAAAQALTVAEDKACAGLDDDDRVTSPFYHREDISEISKADRTAQEGYGTHQEFAGGRAVFRATPGMTAEWLQRLVDCHLARAAAVGNSMPEMNYCPLALKDVSAVVSSAGNGFAITVTSNDPATAAEIWRRIQAAK